MSGCTSAFPFVGYSCISSQNLFRFFSLSAESKATHMEYKLRRIRRYLRRPFFAAIRSDPDPERVGAQCLSKSFLENIICFRSGEILRCTVLAACYLQSPCEPDLGFSTPPTATKMQTPAPTLSAGPRASSNWSPGILLGPKSATCGQKERKHGYYGAFIVYCRF